MAHKRKRLKIELIIWLDSYTSGEKWEKVYRLEKPEKLKCISVGVVLKETKHTIHIVPHISNYKDMGDACACCGMFIPKCAIIKRKKLYKY
jgi:hypothetical protein